MTARRIIERGGASRGICCVVDWGDGELPLAIARASGLLVVVQHERSELVAASRELAKEAGLLNRRIYVIQNPKGKVILASNYADILVVGKHSDIAAAELLRATCPGGTILTIEGQRIVGTKVKPPPPGADDWTHWYHGPDNNPVSTDTSISVPDAFQWLALPHHAATPSITLAAGGRLFTATGGNAQHEREESSLHLLTARNGYNGHVLWTRKLPVGYVVYRSTFVATAETFTMLDYLGQAKNWPAGAMTGNGPNTKATFGGILAGGNLPPSWRAWNCNAPTGRPGSKFSRR